LLEIFKINTVFAVLDIQRIFYDLSFVLKYRIIERIIDRSLYYNSLTLTGKRLYGCGSR